VGGGSHGWVRRRVAKCGGMVVVKYGRAGRSGTSALTYFHTSIPPHFQPATPPAASSVSWPAARISEAGRTRDGLRAGAAVQGVRAGILDGGDLRLRVLLRPA